MVDEVGVGGSTGFRTAPFVGRRAELAVLHARLAAAVRVEPSVVSVEGPPGIGKTALVDRFLAEANAGATHAAAAEPGPGLRVLRVSGDETETLLSYGVVEQFARAAGPAGRPLAPPDATADFPATDPGKIEPGPLDDPVTVGTRILRMLDALGRDGALVLVLDDAHWADLPSLRALIFALRRLVADQLLAVVVTRDDAVPLLPDSLRRLVTGHRGTVLRLAGLGEDDLRDLAVLLGVDGPAATARAAHTLRAATGGSPLHARALLEEFPGRQWGSGSEAVPAPRSFRVLVADRCRGTGPATLALLEAAAVLGSGAELSVAARLAEVADPLAALDEAAKLDLLVPAERPGRRPVAFPHPLVRAAVYDGIGPARCAALHTAAARSAAADGDVVGALRHRVAAATGPDADLAADLAAVAQHEAQRHAWPAAAAHLVQAARLDPDRDRAQQRLLGGVNWMLLTGDVAQAGTFADEVGGFPPGPLRDSVLGFLARARGDPAAAGELLGSAWARCAPGAGDEAGSAVGPEVAATIALQNAVHRYGRLDGAGTVAWSRRALALAGPDTPTNHAARTYLAYGLAYTGAAAEAYAASEGAAERPDAPAYAWLQPRSARGLLRLVDDDLDGARDDLASAAAGASALGVSATASFCLAYLARAEYFAGAWDDAVVHADRAVAVATEADLDFVSAMALAVAALVPAARGDRAGAEALLREASRPGDYERSVASVGLARARLAEARADPEGVLAALEPLRALPFRDAVDEPGFWAWPDLYAEALVALGRVADADVMLVPHEERAAARGRSSPIARLARARGRVEAAAGRPEAAEAAFDRALAALDRVSLPFERARVELAAGAFLRRAGRRRRAVALLETAHQRFRVLGAAPYAERCVSELAASGLHPADRGDRYRAGLTSQELVVARLAAAGRSNREVAGELVVSVKTVEFHLRNVFHKLGVTSRRELGARLAALDEA
jgi:DNA-binding CsgD family transcriptional regulator